MKSPGPHNGHRYIKEQDRLVTETSFQKVLSSNKKRPESRDNNNNNNNNNNTNNKILQPIWDHNFNKAMLLSPVKFHSSSSGSSNGKATNSNNVEDIFKSLLKSNKHHHSNSKSSFVTNIDRPNTPTTYTNTNTHSTLSIISTPDINNTINVNDDNDGNDDNDIDLMINSPLKKSNSEVWFKLKKLWVSVSLELKHAGQDITYDDLLEISTMKECPPHMMHLLGYFLALLGKNADWPGICTFLFRNLQWWLQLIKSIDTSVCSISRCEKAHELKMMDPDMYPPICNMKISVPIFKIIRWVNAFDFLILIIMEINKDINSGTTKTNSKKKKISKNNNVLQYFGIGPDDHLEMLNIFMEAEEDDKYCKSDKDNEDDNNNEQPSHQNIDTSNINNNRKNVTFDVVDDTIKTNEGNKNSSNDDDYNDDDYNDDYENDETHDFEKDEARDDTNDRKIDDNDNANDTNASTTNANDTNANANANDNNAKDTNANDTNASTTNANDTNPNDTNANDTNTEARVDGDIDHKVILLLSF